MAALTQTGQGNGHTSTLSSPQECGHGYWCSGGGSNSHSDSHNSRGGPGQTTQAHSLLNMEHGEEGTGSQSGKSKGNQGPSVRRESAAGSLTPPLSPVLQVPGVGPHGQRVPYTSIHFKPAWGNQGNVAHPLASDSYPGQQ